MRHRFAALALPAGLVPVLASCATDSPPDRGAAGPAPDGVAPADRRQPAPELRVTAFDGRTVTLGGFKGQPVVVNFFESW
jgi:cytochrome oxidase Cu insertion factor (SCO1/SenC/PrrC family)